ncbi:helix-turn-helix domain-containing protein [Castellaniella sp.]|uniref:helix-turn-helix domain-containing protein n=1 Tax=Castellaniella sp. TaxID=1955812 RepID=UPI00355FF1CC
MSDLSRQNPQPDVPAAQPEAAALGHALRAMREARGLTLVEVSARIKYSPAQLGHLEAEEWSRLPQGASLRGLVRNYVRYLDGDIDAILILLNDVREADGPGRSAMRAGVRQKLQHTDLPPGKEPPHRTWAWVLLILVLLGVVGWYAIDRGWIPDDWLIFDWLKGLRS